MQMWAGAGGDKYGSKHGVTGDEVIWLENGVFVDR